MQQSHHFSFTLTYRRNNACTLFVVFRCHSDVVESTVDDDDDVEDDDDDDDDNLKLSICEIITHITQHSVQYMKQEKIHRPTR